MRREVQVVYKRKHRRPIYVDKTQEDKKMKKSDALKIIDERCTKVLLDPVEMLHWVWLRTIITQIPDLNWERYVEEATEILAR